jgi:predicted metal-dependent peptidase
MEPNEQALSKAKIELMSRPDSAFFTTVLFSLRFKWDEDCATAYTNGTVIGMSPTFFMELNHEERVFLLLHEAMHVAYSHMLRLHDREGGKWNVAADHVINLMLLERGFKMPKDGLADPQYSGMSTEEVYNLLPDQKNNPEDMDLREPTDPTEEVQQQIQDIVVRASIQSKIDQDGIGAIPGEIQIFINKLLDPKLPWYRILQKYIKTMAKSDYSFRKPNRRYFPKHYLPSLYSETMINIAIAVDTSGSVSPSDFTVFISEVNSILRMMKPEKITLVQFDTEIKSVDTICNVHDLSKVVFTGQGGTYINPVIEWANENKPQLLLVFSDGGFRFYEETTDVPSIWVIHNNPNFKSVMGKTIHYSI